MATATVDSATDDHHFNHNLRTESLPLVDLRLLSQSELLSLSLCSSSSSASSFNHHRQNEADVATLKIDRSVFNESAGSRKQTFYRLRLAPRNGNLHFSPSSSVRAPQSLEVAKDEESSQILHLLKSLFGSNSHSIAENEKENHCVDKIDLVSDDNLFSVPIQYNKSFEALQSLAAADYDDGMKQAIATSTTDSTANKRKRGRPRKNWSNFDGNKSNIVSVNNETHAIAVYEGEKMEIATAITDSNERKPGRPPKNSSNLDGGNNNVNEERQAIVVCENRGTVEGEEEEKKSGINVESNISVEVDPYGEELRRRTIGMQSEAELLGFLEGLEGEWVSKRKKRKIVDASMLGDVLPTGWKLIVCNKRRAGFFWLDCTGYISPNGQQFMSCKEVSSYLLSKELQDASQSTLGHDGNIQSSDITSYGNAADLALKDNKDGDDLIACPALPVTSSVEHVEQAAILPTGVSGQIQTMEKYKCHKCTVVFEEPDDLLQHLLSSHQRAPKRHGQGSSINEEVIIKNGKYECQFCRKIFEERHRFNGHLGNHIKDYFKRIEASGGGMTIKGSNVSPKAAVHSSILEMQESKGFDLGSVAAHSDIKASHEVSSAVPSCEIKESFTIESYCGKQDTIYCTTNDKAEKINEVTDVVAVENNFCSGAESVLSNNDNSSICKSSNKTTVLKCNIDSLNKIGSQEEGSANCSLDAVERDQVCAARQNENQIITSLIDEHNRERDSDGLLSMNFKEKALDGEIKKDRLLFSSINDMKLDERDFVEKDKLGTGFGYYCLSQEDAAVNMKKQRSSVSCLFAPCDSEQRYGSVNKVDGLSTSIAVEMTHSQDSKGAMPSSSDGKTFLWNNKVNQVSASSVTESKYGELGKSRNNVQTIGFGNNKALTLEETVTTSEPESSLGSCSVIPSWNGQNYFAENDMYGTNRCTKRKFWQGKESEGSELTLFGEQSLGFESNIVKVSSCTSGLSNHNEVQHSKNSDYRKDTNLVVGHVSDVELERSANNFSLGPSGNMPAFAIEDKEVLNGASRNLAQGRNSESSSHRQSCKGQKFSNENNVNMISFITMNEHKNREGRRSCAGEPHHVFHHSRMEQDVDIVKNKMEENCLKDSFFLFSGDQRKFNMEDNKIDLHHSTLDEQKRASIESFFCLSSSQQQVLGVENNSNMVLTGKVQQRPGFEDLYPRKNESVLSFSSHTQPSGNATSEFMWRTDEENDLLGSFANTPSQLVHSSGCFPTYDVVSDKGESELFGEKFNGISGFEGLRSGSMENMEYNFMNSHSDEQKVFSYGADLAQGLDSSVWLEKEAMPLLPKMTNRRHIRTFCAWCRNEFQYEALESEAQVGSLGLTCAACKAKFSGQFNLF